MIAFPFVGLVPEKKPVLARSFKRSSGGAAEQNDRSGDMP
jgi:hypothetical protein